MGYVKRKLDAALNKTNELIAAHRVIKVEGPKPRGHVERHVVDEAVKQFMAEGGKVEKITDCKYDYQVINYQQKGREYVKKVESNI